MALQKTLLNPSRHPKCICRHRLWVANNAPPGWHLGPRMDIGAWLRSLGLERYEAAFRENEMDETVLPNLTAEDLKDLGVGIVGHRRKILDAIGALRVDESTKASSSTAAPKAETVVEDRAERRQVTVLFSDLVGSTALSGRMDPDPPIRPASPILSAASAALWRSTWATAFWSISVIRRRMKMTRSGRLAPRLN